MGLPAATRPTSGSSSCASEGMGREACEEAEAPSFRRMPREAPAVSSMAPLRANALRWSSAALGERKPRAWAISARVGGKPVRVTVCRMRSRICCWRSVSLLAMAMIRCERTVHIYSAILGDVAQKSKPVQGPFSKTEPEGSVFQQSGQMAQALGYSTAAMPAATLSMLPLFRAATQMRPLETA
ncbi:hypothetical protein G6F65_020724 [Rhizopus arrhizus]|nr:hypothetical protein G6F65_020724 [Rhizopus arrhizus]